MTKQTDEPTTYADTEHELEYITLGDRHCWISLRCYANKAVEGWAFMVGGRPLDIASSNSAHGYPSRAAARNAAIDYIEEVLKHRIREAQALIAQSTNFLTEINNIQRQRDTEEGDRNHE